MNHESNLRYTSAVKMKRVSFKFTKCRVNYVVENGFSSFLIFMGLKKN